MSKRNIKQSATAQEREQEAAEARAELERQAAEQGIKPATCFEDLLGPETGQTQEEIQAEVDDFLRMLREWRSEPVREIE
jgi:hypothetical protein